MTPVERVSRRYSPSIVAGYRDGYFSEEEGDAIAREIAASGAQMLFVGISSPVKERFLRRHSAVLSAVPFCMGVGGSFDVIAGEVRRAPLFVQRAGLEWLFRWIQEPRKRFRSDLLHFPSTTGPFTARSG